MVTMVAAAYWVIMLFGSLTLIVSYVMRSEKYEQKLSVIEVNQ